MICTIFYSKYKFQGKSMLKLRDCLIFVAGAQFFHTLNHILLPVFMQFPIDMNFMVLTAALNYWAIALNGLTVILLLWWVKKLSK